LMPTPVPTPVLTWRQRRWQSRQVADTNAASNGDTSTDTSADTSGDANTSVDADTSDTSDTQPCTNLVDQLTEEQNAVNNIHVGQMKAAIKVGASSQSPIDSVTSDDTKSVVAHYLQVHNSNYATLTLKDVRQFVEKQLGLNVGDLSTRRGEVMKATQAIITAETEKIRKTVSFNDNVETLFFPSKYG